MIFKARRNTCMPVALSMVSSIIIAFIVMPVFAENLYGLSLSASPSQVIKGQQAFLTASGTVSYNLLAGDFYSTATYDVIVDFWEKDMWPNKDDYVRQCKTTVVLTAYTTAGNFRCSVTLIPSQYSAELFEGKGTEYVAKITVKLGTNTKATGTTNKVSIRCTNC